MTKDRQICFCRSLHCFYELSVAVCCIRHVAFIRSIAVGILWRILIRCVLWTVWCIWWICAVRIILRHTEMSSFYIRLHCIVSLIFLKLFINRMTTIWCYHKKNSWHSFKNHLKPKCTFSQLLDITLKLKYRLISFTAISLHHFKCNFSLHFQFYALLVGKF